MAKTGGLVGAVAWSTLYYRDDTYICEKTVRKGQRGGSLMVYSKMKPTGALGNVKNIYIMLIDFDL